MVEIIVKPPIGIYDQWLFLELRIKEIDAAILRYHNAQLIIPPEWFKERQEWVDWLKINHPRSLYAIG